MSVKKLTYVHATDSYIAPDGTAYTDEQLDHLLTLEKEWKKSLPKYRFHQLFEVYPAGVPAAKRTIKSQITTERNRKEKDYPLIKKLSAQLAYLNELTRIKRGGEPRHLFPGTVTQDMIERAKEYPISDLIEVNRAHKALCLFHQDTRPSMHIFPDNHYHCFVCGARGDSISIYRALNPNATFKEAINALLSHRI